MDAAQALVIGESLVDVVARADGSVTRAPGGSPMNVAVGLARLGRPTRLLTEFAGDADGDLIAAHLGQDALTVDSGSPARTSVAEATLGADGSASYRFELAWTLTAPVSVGTPLVAHTGSVAAVLAPGTDVVARLFESLPGTCTLTYDLNLRPAAMGARDDWEPRVRRLAGVADVLKASDEDLEALEPGRPYLQTAADLLASGGAAAIAVTRGAAGAVVLTRHGDIDVLAPATTVADTIGAGDSFMAGLIDALWSRGALGSRAALAALTEEDWREVATWSVRAAAITVSRPGADPPSRLELTR